MSAKVILESAGNHAFDLGHIRREGGIELVELLLASAGFTRPATWRLQVQKKLVCTAETAPVRVVDEPKKWAVYLKIKPGDNNSCHYCSLLVPDGMQGDTVFHALKEVEKTLDRNWKYTTREKVSMVPPVGIASKPNGLPQRGVAENGPDPSSQESANVDKTPALPTETQGPTPLSTSPEPTETASSPDPPVTRSATRGWTQDPEKLRLILWTIKDVDGTSGLLRDPAHFSELFSQKLDLKGVNRNEIGGIFTALVRKDLIARVFRGSKPCGYQLTDKGNFLIKDLVESKSTDRPAAVPPSTAIDPVNLVFALGGLAQKMVDAKAQMEQLAAREAVLSQELETIRKKKAEICKFLEPKELHAIATQLYEIQQREKS